MTGAQIAGAARAQRASSRARSAATAVLDALLPRR